MWSAIVGDIVHNMRSALDSFAFTVIESGSTSPLTQEQRSRIQFPITRNRQQFKKWFREKSGLIRGDERASNAFEAVQPWHDLDLAPIEYPEEDVFRYLPLTQLQYLSNHDKHQALHPTVCALNLVFVGLREGVDSQWRSVDPYPWRDGSVVARYEMTGLAPGDEPEIGSEFQVGLAEFSRPLDVTPVTARLSGILRHVHWVIGSVAQDLGDAPTIPNRDSAP